MKELPTALLEVVEVVAIAIGTSVLSAVGFVLESRAFEAITGGELQIGVWFVFMGLVALYFGVYLLGVTELLPRLRSITA